jgi:hypothetical protein
MKLSVRSARRVFLLIMLAGLATIVLPGSGTAVAAEAPVKENLAGHVGWEVDRTTGENLCTVKSGHTCQFAKRSEETGGFEFPAGIAVNTDPTSERQGYLYVADGGSKRVQIFTSAGEFVAMFGWDVNKTREEEAGATQAERNICTAVSSDICQAGKTGSGAGQFAGPQSLAIDPHTGDVYAQDVKNERVQEFSADGVLLSMFGKEVDETKDNTPGATVAEKNICTVASKDKCKSGVRDLGSTEPGAFKFAIGYGNDVVVGGPEDLVYVADERRVQKFTSSGVSLGEVPPGSLPSTPDGLIAALAIDGVGDVYVAYQTDTATMISEIDPGDSGVKRFEIAARETAASGARLEVRAIAVDSAGRLAVSEHETGFVVGAELSVFRGGLYDFAVPSPFLLTEFPTEFGVRGASLAIAFSESDEMYVVNGEEFDSYRPVPVASLVTMPSSCLETAEVETSATFGCKLTGEVNPWNVNNTEVWFEWGRTPAFGLETPVEKMPTGSTPVPVGASLDELRPNETYYYHLRAYDDNVVAPETALASETAHFTTPTVAPKFLGPPDVSSITSSLAILFGQLNPENASTRYSFEYGLQASLANCPAGMRKENCPGVTSTGDRESGLYGSIGTTVEVKGLQPASTYGYRLGAEYENKAKTEDATVPPGPEASFTTAPSPVPVARTGVATAIGSSSAILSGLIDPDGPPVTYSFELGAYEGAATQYAVVYSGSVSAGMADVQESVAVTGLLPGTAYAYRIVVRSGYISSPSGAIDGEPVVFVTAGVPAILTVPTPLAQLPVPRTEFPKVAKSHKGKTKRKQKKAKKPKRGKRARRASV